MVEIASEDDTSIHHNYSPYDFLNMIRMYCWKESRLFFAFSHFITILETSIYITPKQK